MAADQPIKALIQKMDDMGDKIKDGIAVPLKAMGEELEASPKQMIAMATENNKAAMAAVDMAGRSFGFLKDKGKEKWEKIKAGRDKDESKENSKWRKVSQKTSEKTSELIETGAIKTKEGLNVVSDTIKNMMSGSPPYLSTLNDLTKILIRNSEIGTKISRDHLNAQFESMMFAEERHQEDVAEKEAAGIATEEYRKKTRRRWTIRTLLDFRRRRLDGKAIAKRDMTTFDYYDEMLHTFYGMEEDLIKLGAISNTLDRMFDFMVESTPNSAQRIEAEREGKGDVRERTERVKDPLKGSGFLKKALQIIGVGVIGFAVGFVDGFMETIKDLKKFLKKFKLPGKIIAQFEKLQAVFKADGVIGKNLTKVGNFFKSIKDFFLKFIAKSKTLTKVFTFMKGIGSVFGRFFLPITILMGAYEVIKGAIAGFEKGGIIGGIIGAVEGLIGFLVDTPLNAIKDLTAWLLKKFGFTEISKKVSAFEFDIGGLFSDVWYGIINWVRGLFGMGEIGTSNELETPEEEWSLWDTVTNALSSVKTWLLGLFGLNLSEESEWSLSGALTNALSGVGEALGKLFSLDMEKIINSMIGTGFLADQLRSVLGLEPPPGEGEAPIDMGEFSVGTNAPAPLSQEEMMAQEEARKRGDAALAKLEASQKERLAKKAAALASAQGENDQLKSKQAKSDAVASIVQNQFNTSSSSTTKPVFSKSYAIDPSGLDFTADW